MLNQGVDPARILFANPCKSPAALVFARQASVIRTTYDNIDELDKIKVHMPEAELLLRIYAEDDGALINLGDKFGAHLDTTEPLLSRARDLGLEVIGASFHVGKNHHITSILFFSLAFPLFSPFHLVFQFIFCFLVVYPKNPMWRKLGQQILAGTGATNPTSFANAIKNARQVFLQAEQLGYNPTILDVGGGFQDSHFEAMAAVLRDTIHAEFPSGVNVIAEPGRFYARSAYTLACRVISKRRQIGSAAAAGVPDMLYQNDGVYGNFMNVIMEKEAMMPSLVTRGPRQVGQHRYSIWGPTCDSIDCVAREVTLDVEVRLGDWLKYKNMGGQYTIYLLVWAVNLGLTGDSIHYDHRDPV